MFNNISWQGYWITIALLSAGYYLVIYLLYFRKNFKIEWSKHSKSTVSSSSPAAPDAATPQQERTVQPALFESADDFHYPKVETIEHTVYACMDEINAYMLEAKRSKCAKEELMYGLHGILRKYPTISASEYKESLTNVIVNQCEYLCSVHLSADDVVRVWLGW